MNIRNIGVTIFLVVVFCSSASANTIQIFDIDGNGIFTSGKNPEQYTVSCAGVGICVKGFYEVQGSTSLELNQYFATGYELSNSGHEIDDLNALLTTLPAPTVTYENQVDVAASSFTTNRQYFSIKKAQWTAFFVNESAGYINVSFDPKEFSHYTEYGETVGDVPAVPIPAAAWLFGSVVLGAGLTARRRRKA